jgi:hypothetical protein
LFFAFNGAYNQAVYKTGLYFDPKHFGHSSWHGWERNRYLRNNGEGTFLELGHATGTDLILNSRGVAVADFWNCGIMDIAVSASADRHALFKNSHLFLHSPVSHNVQQARHDCCLMYVQSTTAFHQRLHNASLEGDCCAAGLLQTLPCVLPVSRFDKA